MNQMRHFPSHLHNDVHSKSALRHPHYALHSLHFSRNVRIQPFKVHEIRYFDNFSQITNANL